MRNYLLFSKCFLLGAIAVSCANEGQDTNVNQFIEEFVVGGQLDTTGIFPSTIQYNETCTGTVVGDYHVLTAAHCVVFNGFMPEDNAITSYKFGHPFHWHKEVLFKDAKENNRINKGNIVKTFAHPSFFELTSAHPEVPGASINITETTDLAIVVLEDKIDESIPRAKIDFDYIPEAGDTMYLNGYGCEQNIDFVGPESEWLKRKKYLLAGIANVNEVQFEQKYDSKFLDGRYILDTTGLTAAERSRVQTIKGSLCPGDSGGAAFRKVGDEMRVIGVNSSIFGDGSFIARVDKKAASDSRKNQAARWLKNALKFNPNSVKKPKDFSSRTVTCSKRIQDSFNGADANPSYELKLPKLTYKAKDGEVFAIEGLEKLEIVKKFVSGSNVYQSTIEIPVELDVKQGPLSYVGTKERKANNEVLQVSADVFGYEGKQEFEVRVFISEYPWTDFENKFISFKVTDLIKGDSNCKVVK